MNIYNPRMPQPHETSRLSRSSVFVRKQLRNELQGKWLQDKNFFKRFFPVDAEIREASSEAQRKLYNKSGKGPRWAGVPSDPKSLGPRLYSGLNNLLNAILCEFVLDHHETNRRLFIQTHRRKVLPYVNRPIWPAILLAGTDSYFLQRPSIRPIADYRCGISPLEVILDSADLDVALHRLGTMVQGIFDQQPTRRFVFGLVMSASAVTCCLFDHSGVFTSPPLAYHEHPDQFCALIAGLASTDSIRIGMDNSAYLGEGDLICIGTRDTTPAHHEGDLYLLLEMLYHAPHMIGRGTACFLAHRTNDTKTEYVIKDAWISADDPESEGRESEAALLCHAKSKGVTQGVAQILHSEDVRFPDADGRLLVDNIYNIRRMKSSEYSNVRQCVHTRIVMSTYGKPLEEFETRKELLLALYDAVRAHRNLYEKAGILHRDIKPGNILINSNGEDGTRGIIIDLDHAIRIDDTSPYSKRKNIGTPLFMSINVLVGRNPHDYMDDLESFYYVLLYMLTVFTAPHVTKDELPGTVRSWGVSSGDIKRGQLMQDIDLFEISPWFGQSFRRLVERLQGFFACRLVRGMIPSPAPSQLPAHQADEFLSHIRQAIDDLEEEENASQPLPEHTHHDVEIADTQHVRRPRPRVEVEDTLAASRSLRPNVNYRRHRNR